MDSWINDIYVTGWLLFTAEPTSLQRRGESEPAPADGANLPRDAAGCCALAAGAPGTRPGITDLVGLRVKERRERRADPAEQGRSAPGGYGQGRRSELRPLAQALPPLRRLGHGANRHFSVPLGAREARPTAAGARRNAVPAAPPAISRSTSAAPGEGLARQRRSSLVLLPDLLLGAEEKSGFTAALAKEGGRGGGRRPRSAAAAGAAPGGRRARCRRAGHTCRPFCRRLRGWTAGGTGWEGPGSVPPPSSAGALQRRCRGSVQPSRPAGAGQPGAVVPRPEVLGLHTPFPPGAMDYEMSGSAPHRQPQRGTLLQGPGRARV